MSKDTLTAAEFDERLLVTTVHMQQETERLREQNLALRNLLESRRQFAERLEQTLKELKTEQERMDNEARRLLSAEEFSSVTISSPR